MDDVDDHKASSAIMKLRPNRKYRILLQQATQ